MRKIVVTGATGYLGSHMCSYLIRNGFSVFGLDNLSRSSIRVVNNIKQATNRSLQFENIDLLDGGNLNDYFQLIQPDVVFHFAGLKSVAESILEPITYYQNNVTGTINLLNSMSLSGCHEIIFSSSATVYNQSVMPPFSEDDPTGPVNPYGTTKLCVENLLREWVKSGPGNLAACLRYFNPIGADVSGYLGEDLSLAPSNIMPLVLQTFLGRRNELQVFGCDYETRDGTGERDYVHVNDLIRGHGLALTNRKNMENFEIINLGTGKGTTVLELIAAFDFVSGVKLPVASAERRIGDVAASYADTTKAKAVLGFECEHDIYSMCEDSLRWAMSLEK